MLHGFDLFTHVLISSTLQLDFRSSVQCSSAGLDICFQQLLDEGSMVRFKIVINLITGKGQFGHLLLYCLGFPIYTTAEILRLSSFCLFILVLGGWYKQVDSLQQIGANVVD